MEGPKRIYIEDLDGLGMELSAKWYDQHTNNDCIEYIRADTVKALVVAAKEIKRVRDAQAEYTKKLCNLAAEAKRTGKNLSHRIPDPVVHDYGTAIERLINALAGMEES